MKKLLLILIVGLISFTVKSQEPLKRQLPNQFRDFLDHQQRWNMERPKIERKDGKVIITMTEEQFKRLQMMRQRSSVMMVRNHQNLCRMCEMKHKRHGHKVKNAKRS